MAPQNAPKKRKAITHDSPESDEVALSDGGDEFETALFNGIDTGSNDELDHEEVKDVEEEEEEDDEENDGLSSESFEDDIEGASNEDIDSDEIPSDGESEVKDHEKQNGIQRTSSEHNYGVSEEKIDEEDALDGITNGPSTFFKVTEDADGNPRYLYDDINPVYDSDDSDAPATANTVGNIPSHFYDSYPHIGYDINGKKISRPARGEALDALLDSIEVPKGWTGLTDPATGKPLELSQEELEVLKKIQYNEIPDEGYDPYPATIEYFTSKTEHMPLSAAPEPKRRFIPSKHEAKRVMKIVRAIREGRIMPYKPPSEEEEDEKEVNYDLWANEAPTRSDHIAAPKLPPPGFEESYHPPPEYLPDKDERKTWDEQDEEDRDKDFLPMDYDALRKVPGYDKFVKEKFERCLDLYLAPRIRRSILQIDPDSLLPKLPSPEELRPFPTACATLYRGHEGRVRSLAIDPSGIWLASGGDDSSLRVWELLTGRQIWSVTLEKGEAVNVVEWRPGTDAVILAAATGENVYIVAPPISDPETERNSREVVDAGFGFAAQNTSGNPKKEPAAQWIRPSTRLSEQGVLVKFALRKTVKVISWHRRGEYFSTVSPQGQSSSVAIHTLSKHLTQFPFRKLKGLVQSAQFHPLKPIFFVATQRMM